MTINQNTKLLALTMNPPIIIKTRTKANKNLDLDLKLLKFVVRRFSKNY